MSCRSSTATCAARPRAWRWTIAFDAKIFAQLDAIDETKRAEARRRLEQELQQNLQALARGWRRALLFVVPGVVAGVALAFALAWWLDTGWRDAHADRAERGRIRHGQFRAGAPDRDDRARRRPRRPHRPLARVTSSNSAVGRASARLRGQSAKARPSCTMRAPCTPRLRCRRGHSQRRQLQASPHRSRRGLRRHRHQPAVRLPRVPQSRARHRRHAAEHHRPAVADPLVAGAGHLDQVRRDRVARRQSRRRRRARAEHFAVEREQQLADMGDRSARSVCSARRCSSATASSLRRSPCSARWKVSPSRRRGWSTSWCPARCIILTVLFMVQRRGTGAMGRMFGPVTLVWFVDARAARRRAGSSPGPTCVFAINPLYAVHFFINNGWAGFVTLASVFLAVTGGEALYADMGHFGRAPIRRGWFIDRAAGAGAELLRPGRAAAGESERDLQPVLPDGAELAAAGDHRAGDCGDGDRFAGGDLRRVLDHAPGAESRLPAAAARVAFLGRRDRPGVRADRELAAVRGHDDADPGVPILERAGGRVRHRDFQHDADRQHPGDHAVARAARKPHRRPADGGARRSSSGRARVLPLEPAEVRRRRLAADRRRDTGLRADDAPGRKVGARSTGWSPKSRCRCATFLR